MYRAVVLVVLAGCGPIYPQPPPQQQPTAVSAPARPPDAPPDPIQERVTRYEPPTVPTPPTSKPAPLDSAGRPIPSTMGTQAEIAAAKHWEGEELYRRGKYGDASSRFREALARVPEARYFYNLCASLYMEGKFGEALTACDAVDRNNPTATLRSKAAGLEARVKDEARAQGIDVAPP